ncbi:hypothetical protein SAMN05428989_4111 [Pseudoxanthomonas sp. GM95]|uniref:hypothetical protein n=1 Tax=Pseudoxanthomonas sp. GM95 TaxID=1881043 RepID=UPI0008C7AEA4|nr:hypothetical protein [Pseudoxanthomonas sp. GM95]SEM58286.1 hypothetical protein SAMN05428989_4111 [Pseudoxanthomonas sp. GM95]
MEDPGLNFIIGNSDDYHANAVLWALLRAGRQASIWDGIGSSAEDGISLWSDSDGASVRIGDVTVNRVNSVWYRRPVPYRVNPQISQDAKPFVETELKEAYVSAAAVLNERASFIVGKIENRVPSAKGYQLLVAQKCGFKTPRTIISNQYDQIMEFASGHDRLAVKHFAPHYWLRRDGSSSRYVQTSLVESLASFNRDSIEATPCIYQEFIDKQYELRVTIIGDRIYAAKIDSRSGAGFVDWRFEAFSEDFQMKPHQLDQTTEARILAVMKQLGLHYGCMDLIVTPDNQLYFLEVNPGGQFLFVEDALPQYELLRSFASMLAAGRSSYDLLDAADLSVQAYEQSPEFLAKKGSDEKVDTRYKFITMVA